MAMFKYDVSLIVRWHSSKELRGDMLGHTPVRNRPEFSLPPLAATSQFTTYLVYRLHCLGLTPHHLATVYIQLPQYLLPWVTARTNLSTHCPLHTDRPLKSDRQQTNKYLLASIGLHTGEPCLFGVTINPIRPFISFFPDHHSPAFHAHPNVL